MIQSCQLNFLWCFYNIYVFKQKYFLFLLEESILSQTDLYYLFFDVPIAQIM